MAMDAQVDDRGVPRELIPIAILVVEVAKARVVASAVGRVVHCAHACIPLRRARTTCVSIACEAVYVRPLYARPRTRGAGRCTSFLVQDHAPQHGHG